MSEDRLNIFRRLTRPALLGYVLVWASGLVAYFFLMSSRASDIMALIAIFLAIPGVLLRWGVSPILFVLLTTYGMIDPGFFSILNFLGSGKWYALSPSSGFNIEDCLIAASVLAYLIGHYRLAALLGGVLPNEPSVRREVEMPDPTSRPETQVGQDELPRVLMIGGGCVVAAQAIVVLVAAVERGTQPHAYAPANTRTLLFLWGGGSLAMVITAALCYWRMSQMSPNEAAMVVRDATFHENRRETDRVERWRKWFKTKMSRKRAGR